MLEAFKRHQTPSRTCPKIRSHESNEYPTRGFTRRTKKVYGWSYAGLVHPMNGLHRHIGGSVGSHLPMLHEGSQPSLTPRRRRPLRLEEGPAPPAPRISRAAFRDAAGEGGLPNTADGHRRSDGRIEGMYIRALPWWGQMRRGQMHNQARIGMKLMRIIEGDRDRRTEIEDHG